MNDHLLRVLDLDPAEIADASCTPSHQASVLIPLVLLHQSVVYQLDELQPRDNALAFLSFVSLRVSSNKICVGTMALKADKLKARVVPYKDLIRSHPCHLHAMHVICCSCVAANF